MTKLVKVIFLISIAIASCYGQSVEILKNDRELDSFYSKTIYSRTINLLTISYDKEFIREKLKQALAQTKQFSKCILDLNFQIRSSLNNSLTLDSFYLLARRYNLIDDFILEQGLMSSAANINPQNIRTTSLAQKNSLSELFNNSKRSCIISNWQSYLVKLKGKKNSISNFKVKKNLKADISYLNLKNSISKDLYALHSLKLNKHNLPSLKKYLETKAKLREKFPVKDLEYSNFVTAKRKKMKRSKRNIFYGSYNETSIIKMSGVMSRLIEHVESPKMVLNIYGEDDNIIRSVPFLPMDRFRFSIRFLRQEMNELKLDPSFNGASPSYEDIIIAAFETGVVAADDLTDLSEMEDLWNPQRTFLDKSMVWIRAFVPVATILIPPPYNIIASLAVVIIEITTQKPEPTYDHALFTEL